MGYDYQSLNGIEAGELEAGFGAPTVYVIEGADTNDTIGRTIPSALAAHISGEALTLALLVRVERRDGTVFGFTTTDKNITYNGLIYEALSAVQATSVRQEINTNVDNLDVWGLIQSDHVTDDDLRAGRYDAAKITIYICNFMDISAGVITLLKGQVGSVTIEDGKYTAEVRSLTDRLRQKVTEVTTKTCRVRQLGDARCAAGASPTSDMSLYRFNRAVLSVTSSLVITFDGDSHATGYYDYGKVKFLTGLNTNIEREVKSHQLVSGTAVLTLQEPFPFAVAVADIAQLEAGCDRTFDSCKNKFSNWKNFRGEKDIPLTDIITQRGRGGS